MNARYNSEKEVIKTGLHDKQSDFAYWQNQPYQLRLAQLEQIRLEYHRWKYDAEPRLQRVYKIVSLRDN